jgi:hypothetical protein
MFYKVHFTMPTLKIKTIEDYKIRTDEILFWQIKDTLQSKLLGMTSLFQSRTLDDVFLSLGLLLISVITFPFTILYILLCLTELLLDTLFLPIFLIPVLRIFPTVITVIVWAISFGVGVFAGALLERS